ncbi:hypothetical protein AAHA92_19548 [Salvia divinorum]|uniref:Zinc finger PHD-type domain-containing protein n=1 Tax=Salvia divinorum TaxID=28513 RepID=A0ABD1H8H4_SALDI
MSERGEDEERDMVDHWSHEHPLTLVETRREDECYGCEQSFSSGEQAYGCIIEGCQGSKLLHEECAVMARKIQHPLHPQHILIQQRPARPSPFVLLFLWFKCDFCDGNIFSSFYECASPRCTFKIHLRCAQGGGVMDALADDDDEQRCAMIRHPSHPSHELKLWRRRCSFKCDACGATRRGSSYTCTNEACQYWIHERCATLPLTMEREVHHHSLSLCFHAPSEYITFDYKCDICSKPLQPKNWMYHCQICRYIVHINCAFTKLPHTIENYADAKDIIHLPTNEVAEELITPFVMRQGGEGTLIPPIIPRDDELVNAKYKFLHHQHELTLVSSDQNQDEEEEEDEENYGKRWELICDGCITPISSSSSKYYYMKCRECKYNLHMACFHLPPHLSSLPLLHRDCHHHLLLISSDKLKPWEYERCSACRYYMNGLFYACGECGFKADIKCACLPDTIHHAAHPQHLLNYVTDSSLWREKYSLRLMCAAGCGYNAYYWDCYRCSSNSCDFIVHIQCMMVPASVTSSRWDEHHTLPLTYDATLNRPGDFYCDQCEKQMNPKSWMYHCRRCDLSFHPECFLTTSGIHRNIKMGQEYVNAEAHPHTLTYQLLTTKRRCDVCSQDRHEDEGFHCASCNFFICLNSCGREMIQDGDMKAVD